MKDIMNRYDYNIKLLEILKRKIEDNPDLRFIQALWACKFIDSYENCEIVDRFYEESETTLKRINEIKEDTSYNKIKHLFNRIF